MEPKGKPKKGTSKNIDNESGSASDINNCNRLSIDDIVDKMNHELEWKRVSAERVIENMQDEIAWLRRGIDIYRAERSCPCNDTTSWQQDNCPVCMWESEDDAKTRRGDNSIRFFSRMGPNGGSRLNDQEGDVKT